ncbi:MAG: cyclodeaminase/cyclohydrolase family protein [Planctomycetota bacterium]
MSGEASLDPAELGRMPLATVLESISAAEPVPGGGAVAGLVEAIGAALGLMVVGYSEGRKSLADHAAMHADAREQLEGHRRDALELAAADAAAYARLNALWRRPADDPERRAGMPEAVAAAIAAPRAMAETGLRTLESLERLVGRSNRHLGSDLAIAAILAEAAVRSAIWNVRINLPWLEDDAARTEVRRFAEQSLKEAASRCRRIEESVAEA